VLDVPIADDPVSQGFANEPGRFYLWDETDEMKDAQARKRRPPHPVKLSLLGNIGLANTFVYVWNEDENPLLRCQTVLNEVCRKSTNLHIEEHTIMRRAPQKGNMDPICVLTVHHRPITDGVHHWWHDQDDLEFFHYWLEPAYRGPLDLFMRTLFAHDVARPNNYQTGSTKGIRSTWVCTYRHGIHKWLMKADPMGHGIIKDSNDVAYEATTHAVYVDKRPHLQYVKWDQIFTWLKANPEQS